MRIRYLINTWKSNGLIGTFKILYSAYLKTNKFIVFHMGQKRINSFHKVIESDIQLKKVTVEELKSLREEHHHLPIQFFCDQSHRFKNPYIAFIDNNIAAIDWLVFSDEDSRFLSIAENDVEMNYNTVVPEFQGNGISRVLKEFMIHDCFLQGLMNIFVVVNVDNVPQCKLLTRIGFEPVEVLTHFAWHRPKAELKYVDRVYS